MIRMCPTSCNKQKTSERYSNWVCTQSDTFQVSAWYVSGTKRGAGTARRAEPSRDTQDNCMQTAVIPPSASCYETGLPAREQVGSAQARLHCDKTYLLLLTCFRIFRHEWHQVTGDANTQNSVSRTRRWCIMDTTNLGFHVNYVKGHRALILHVLVSTLTTGSTTKL
jgi:hypothetical protein